MYERMLRKEIQYKETMREKDQECQERIRKIRDEF